MDLPPEPADAIEERSFREEQRSGIGATDTPKILGFSRYGTARTVYERLTGPEVEQPTRLPAWVGINIQTLIGELYSTATGYTIRAARQHYRHPEDDWLVCHLDYRVARQPNILVECKSRASMTGWGEDGSQDVPKDVWSQVQHEMMVMGATECHVAALFGHHTFRVYPIQRNDQFITALRALLRDFWHDNVLAGVPPPLSGNPMDAALMQRDHPEHGGVYRNATPSQAAVVQELWLADMAYRESDTKREAVKNRIKELIGDALGLIGPFGRITWKRTSDYQKVDWELVAKAYRQIILAEVEEPPIDMSGPDALDAIQSLYTHTVEGTRRFTMDWEEV